MTNSTTTFEDDGDLKFPVITISVSNDDLEEPIHVDLGSVPPFIAAAVLEKVASILKSTVPAPRITFKGTVLVEPIGTGSLTLIEQLFDDFNDDEDDDDEDKK